MPMLYRGLDLLRPDETSEDEVRAWSDYYAETKGQPLPAFDFWVENRPDVLKRYALQASKSRSREWGDRRAPWSALLFLHYYALVGYEDGIVYEIMNARWGGATKAQVLDVLAIAFLHAGPRGMRYVATSSQEYMASWAEEPDAPAPTFHEGWSVDHDAFRSGIDFSDPEMTPEDEAALRGWYERVCGEVPPYVDVLARYRPVLLKAHRNRLEHAIRGQLPAQSLPYLQLQWNVTRGFGEGIREALLTARGLGMTHEQAVDAIGWGFLYGGPASVSVVETAAGDVLRAWAAE